VPPLTVSGDGTYISGYPSGAVLVSSTSESCSFEPDGWSLW
jgi:hypothetical protein